MPQFSTMHPIIAELCRGIRLTQGLGEHLLYSGCEKGRPYRILMFMLLLNESINMKNNYKLAYHLLKEAYLMTDNVYGQLKNSTYPFVLKDYLTELEAALLNRDPDELHEEEKAFTGVFLQRLRFSGICVMMRNNRPDWNQLDTGKRLCAELRVLQEE